MFKSLKVVLFASLTLIMWFCSKSQQEDLVGDLRTPTLEQFLSILLRGTVNFVGDCSPESDGSKIQYWLYTQQVPRDPVKITSYNQIDVSKPLVFLLFGWKGNRDVDYIQAIKDAYVPFKDFNVIVVDYEAYVSEDYVSSFCNVPLVGSTFAKYLCDLSAALNVPIGNIHVVGHSLGAQVSGIAGSKTTCGQIGRITGLDPAGPLFQDVALESRLDKTDAVFVDVIHTDQGKYGYIGNCGDVDFYPNCGVYQPGCLNSTITAAFENVNDIIKIPMNLIICSHQRSCYLFAESIIYNDLPSYTYPLCGLSLSLSICNDLPGTKVYMGEYLRSKPSDPEYFLDTKAKSLYGCGPNGPTD